MRRAWLIGLLAGAAALLWLCLPAPALAGTYSWDMPGNFTATPPGANPDNDSFGGTPWSYVASSGTANTLLSPFSTSVAGTGLAGWGGVGAQPYVAINPGGSAVTSGTATFPAGQLVLRPGAGQSAAVVWTAPLTGSVTVSGTLTQDDSGSLTCPYSTTWAVARSGDSGPLASGSISPLAPGPATFSQTVTVTQGQSIQATVSNGLLGNPTCDATGLVLNLTAAAAAPQVTLATPGNGALISGQPTFSGSAGTGFGAANTVTVRVYSGRLPSGTPAETITATRTGGTYSVGPSPLLADGTYTAQAEQDDLAGDQGLSGPVTFAVSNAPSTIQLDSLGTKPLLTSTPTLTGTAATAPGDASAVVLAVYPGSDTTGTAVRFVAAAVSSGGHFSVAVTPALDDGQYTAVATQTGAAATGFSPPVTFRIKIHAPALTLDAPASGAKTGQSHPVFSGDAGNRLGDSPLVRVVLYSGAGVHGKRLGSMRVSRTGGSWRGRFPFHLGLGRYTVQATQTDDAGHTSLSPAHTFTVVAASSVIGATVAMSGATATVAVSCLTPAGTVCTGTVLILTVRSFQAVTGGPQGKLRLLFAYVSIPAGSTDLIKRRLSAAVARTLRQANDVKVLVSASLSRSGGSPKMFESVRLLRISR